MMANFGPLEACRKVIVSTPPPDGFIRLLELERAGYDALKLTAEAAVLRGPWRVLFEEPIRELARKRLVEYGRRDLAAP